ncbi:MAG: response regulator transcription factor [Campylobacterota bacterium]|nr:response regulator transcription factor [Campylobacterota bacterium]
MIYIDSNFDIIQEYWKKNYIVRTIDNSFFDIEHDFYEKDIFILDIDQFKTIDDVIEYFEIIPKSLKVVALTNQPKLAQGAFFIKKGFKSYLGKNTSKIIIDQAIQTIKSGNVWIYPQLMNFIIKNISIETQNDNRSKSLDELSSKEQDVASLVAQGFSNKEIGQNLGIQLVTVKKHVSSIFLKLNVKDRVALAILINQ